MENKRQSKEVYLYDPRYNRKELTTYDNLNKVFGMSLRKLSDAKFEGKKIKKIWYILDINTSKKEFRELYIKEKFHNETWKVIEGSDDKFLVSNYGRFKRIQKSSPEGKFILPYTVQREVNKNNNKQFIKVKFLGKYTAHNVARIVAYHFVDVYYDRKPVKYKNKSYDDLVVYHKNGRTYDNYHNNLEWIDRDDLAKKTAITKCKKPLVAIDYETNEIIDYYNSTRDAAKYLFISKSAIQEGLSKNKVIGGRYIFRYED
ncbi:MAG: NUMOD4 domain-containing protein [Cetobacterium sp.]